MAAAGAADPAGRFGLISDSIGGSTTDRCPSCGFGLATTPKANRKCPACREWIKVRVQNGQTRLLKTDDAFVFDAEANSYWERRRWIQKAEPWGVDEASFVAIEAELGRKGVGYGPRDAWWVAANRAALTAAAGEDWRLAGSAYWEMAQVLCDETDQETMPRQAVHLKREASKAEMRTYGSEVRVSTSGCACDPCSRDTGARATADELAAPRIPHADCEAGCCSCTYMPVLR